MQSPEIPSKFGVDLSEDVDVDPVIVLLDGLAGHKLRDHGTVSVDLVFQRCVQVLLLDGVGHDDEEKVEVLGLLGLLQLLTVGVLAADVLQVVVVDCLFECLYARLVAQFYNIAVINVYLKVSFR